MRIDDLDHLPETTTIDASSIGIVQVSTEWPCQRGVPRDFHLCRCRQGGASRTRADVRSVLGRPLVHAACLPFVSHSVFLAHLLPKSLLASVSF